MLWLINFITIALRNPCWDRRPIALGAVGTHKRVSFCFKELKIEPEKTCFSWLQGKLNKGFCDILEYQISNKLEAPCFIETFSFSFHSFIKKNIMNEAGFNFQLKESQTICCSVSPQPAPFAVFILSVQVLYNSTTSPVQQTFQTATFVSCHHISDTEFSHFKRDFTSHFC